MPTTDVRMLPGPLSAASRSACQDGWCTGLGLCWWIATRMFQVPAASGCLHDRDRLTEWQRYHSGERREIESLAEQLLVLFKQDRAMSAMVVLQVSDIVTVVGVMRHR